MKNITETNCYQVCDIILNKTITRSTSKCILRLYSENAKKLRKTGSFDPTLKHLNFEIVNGEIFPVNKNVPLNVRFKENMTRATYKTRMKK